MKLYIASRFKNKEFIKEFIETLPEHIIVVSTWHTIPDTQDTNVEVAVGRDLSELDKADSILLITKDCELTPGGLHFEAGYAYAKQKGFFILGPAVNIFCTLANPIKKVYDSN